MAILSHWLPGYWGATGLGDSASHCRAWTRLTEQPTCRTLPVPMAEGKGLCHMTRAQPRRFTCQNVGQHSRRLGAELLQEPRRGENWKYLAESISDCYRGRQRWGILRGLEGTGLLDPCPRVRETEPHSTGQQGGLEGKHRPSVLPCPTPLCRVVSGWWQLSAHGLQQALAWTRSLT